MDFSPTEDQQALQELARKILEEQATPDRIRRIEAGEEDFDAELWHALAKANLLGVAIGEAYGGSGFGILELCLLLEEVGRTVAPVPVWPTLAACALSVERFGTEDQKQRLLPGVVSGDLLLSAAFLESETGDPLRPATRADADEDGFRLTGTWTCVPLASRAERILVPGSTGPGSVGLFLVDPRTKGVTLDPQRSTHGERQFRVTLEGVRVPAQDVLCGPQSDGTALAWTLERATTGLCAMQLGSTEAALRMTAEYTNERQQFGRPIGSFQAVHQRAADAYIDLETMRLTLWQAAFLLSLDRPAGREVAVAKFFASEAGHRVAYAAQHLHGGIGMDVEYPVHRHYLWARQIELTLGSPAEQLETLGRALAEAPAGES